MGFHDDAGLGRILLRDFAIFLRDFVSSCSILRSSTSGFSLLLT
jgi:hypothetical protein